MIGRPATTRASLSHRQMAHSILDPVLNPPNNDSSIAPSKNFIAYQIPLWHNRGSSWSQR